jgi:hypothetical protein
LIVVQVLNQNGKLKGTVAKVRVSVSPLTLSPSRNEYRM